VSEAPQRAVYHSSQPNRPIDLDPLPAGLPHWATARTCGTLRLYKNSRSHIDATVHFGRSLSSRPLTACTASASAPCRLRAVPALANGVWVPPIMATRVVALLFIAVQSRFLRNSVRPSRRAASVFRVSTLSVSYQGGGNEERKRDQCAREDAPQPHHLCSSAHWSESFHVNAIRRDTSVCQTHLDIGHKARRAAKIELGIEMGYEPDDQVNVDPAR
jgi:hypothetical protein